MRCGCPPLAVDMNINGRLSAVLAFTSTGYVRASWRWTTSSQAPTVLRTGYATYCGYVGERDAVGNLVRSSQAYCSPHESPVGSRGIARTAMCASCLRRLRPVLICEAHSFETCPLNHAQPANLLNPRRFSPRRFVWRGNPATQTSTTTVYTPATRSAATSAGSCLLRPAPVPPTCDAAGRLGICA